MSRKTILVPVDFGEATAAALAEAKELGRRLGADVELLHVVGLPLDVAPGFGVIATPDLQEAIMTAAKQGLDRLAREQGDLAHDLTVGDPAREVLRVAGELRPTYLVLGTHGRRGAARLFLGSVTERILRESPVPVVTVRPGVMPPATAPAKRSIVVPVDFQALSRVGIEKAKELAGPLEAEVVLVHSFHPPVFGYPDAPEEIGLKIYHEVAAAAGKALDSLSRDSGGLRSVLRNGEPAAAIIDVIDELRPVLVVIGTHGRRGFARFFLGSIAERVVRESPAPVLVVRDLE